MTEKEQTLAAIFYQALKNQIPGLEPRDVVVEEFTREYPEDLDNLKAAQELGLIPRYIQCDPRTETTVTFPRQAGLLLPIALQQAAIRLTRHWTAFSSNCIAIQADLDTVARGIDDSQRLAGEWRDQLPKAAAMLEAHLD